METKAEGDSQKEKTSSGSSKSDGKGLEKPRRSDSVQSTRSNVSREFLDAIATSAAASSRKHVADLSTLENVPPHELTGLRAHYLKKELVSMQFEVELQSLTVPDALSCIGPPFAPASSENKAALVNVDLPFLRFAFRKFFLTFPFLRKTKIDFWQKKVQPFVNSFVSKGISTSDDREDSTKRKRVAFKLEKHLGLLLSNGLKLADPPGEEVVRVRPADLERIDKVAAQSKNIQGFEINVVGVRTVKTKARLRDRVHEEFIISTNVPDRPAVFVARRYGAFRGLTDQLKLEFPDEEVRSLPHKNKANHKGQIVQQTNEDGRSIDVPFDKAEQGSGSPREASDMVPLAREKNRLTLRAYLRSLLKIRSVANSNTLKAFLLDDPISLSDAELIDTQRREAMDRMREEEQLRFKQEADRRVAELDEHLEQFKKELMGTSGLTNVFKTIQQTSQAKDLPSRYRKVLEWGRITLASTIYQLFLGSDDSSEVFSQLKRIHGMVPYFMFRQILRISNPVAMIRGVIDLFLAQPFGQRSLLQRMFSGTIQEDLREIGKDIEAVAAKINSPQICAKLKYGVNLPLDKQKQLRVTVVSSQTPILMGILLSDEGPHLQTDEVTTVQKAWSAHQTFRTKNPSGGEPDNEDAWLYEDLHVLYSLYIRQHDKEQINSLLFEGNTAELLRDIVTIFYEPLARVYKAANISDSLGDLQRFLDDLIKTVEKAEQAMVSDPQTTVQTFMDLTGRHEQAFYNFVHQVHAKGAGLFDDLMHWVEGFVAFLREGFAQAVDLEFLLPEQNEERIRYLSEVDELIQHHYRLKLAHEERMRRRLMTDQVAAEEMAVNDILENLKISGLRDDIEDMEGDTESEEEDYEVVNKEKVRSSTRVHHKHSRSNASNRGHPEPTLEHLPQLRPLFVEVIRPLLEHALMEDAQKDS